MRKSAFSLYNLFFSKLEHFSPVYLFLSTFPLFGDFKIKIDNSFSLTLSTTNSRHARECWGGFAFSVLLYVICECLEQVNKKLKNIYCKMNCTENDWPWGEWISICLGLSLWSRYTHIPTATLWLLRLSSNDLVFAFSALSNHLYHLVNSYTRVFFKSILGENRRCCCFAGCSLFLVHCHVSEAFINYVHKAHFTGIFPLLNEWNSLLFIC